MAWAACDRPAHASTARRSASGEIRHPNAARRLSPACVQGQQANEESCAQFAWGQHRDDVRVAGKTVNQREGTSIAAAVHCRFHFGQSLVHCPACAIVVCSRGLARRAVIRRRVRCRTSARAASIPSTSIAGPRQRQPAVPLCAQSVSAGAAARGCIRGHAVSRRAQRC